MMDDTAAKILEAAGRVFAEKGFQAATVRKICALAEVNLAGVNYHFRDKETLYATALRHAHEAMVLRFPTPEWPAGTSPEQKLRDFIHTMLSRMLAKQVDSWQSKLMMREVLTPSDAGRELVSNYFRPHFDLLNAILRELLPADTTDLRRHHVALSVIGQCTHYKLGCGIISLIIPPEEYLTGYTVEILTEHITQMSLHGLRN
ncbi:MAG: CerR family C-terminal domain-containing protein [Pirellulales bacterium]